MHKNHKKHVQWTSAQVKELIAMGFITTSSAMTFFKKHKNQFK